MQFDLGMDYLGLETIYILFIYYYVHLRAELLSFFKEKHLNTYSKDNTLKDHWFIAVK